MNTEVIFFIVWLTIVIVMMYIIIKRGKKALAIFPDEKKVTILYRDRKASGFSTKSFITKIGGASNSLDIIVTEDELWTKGNLLFADFMRKYDLLHRIPLKKITSIETKKGDKIEISFTPEAYLEKTIVIKTNRNFLLVELLKKLTSDSQSS
jgi:hypothetical protein